MTLAQRHARLEATHDALREAARTLHAAARALQAGESAALDASEAAPEMASWERADDAYETLHAAWGAVFGAALDLDGHAVRVLARESAWYARGLSGRGWT